MTKLLLLLLLFSSNSSAIDFFEAPIDWDDSSLSPIKTTEEQEKKDPKKKEDGQFSWKPYLNPSENPEEFFKEGNHVPPRPFMEMAINPSDENIKNWFAYMKLKNDLSTRLSQRIQEYSGSSNPKLKPEGKAYLRTKAQSLPIARADPTDFRFRIYFDSKCPHCKRMFETMGHLQSDGYYVEAIQIDDDREAAKGIPFPVVRATKKEIEAHGIKSVPYVLIADLKQKALLPPIVGYQSYQAVTEFLAKAQAMRSKGMDK